MNARMRAALLLVVVALAPEGRALAADPTVAECLDASNTSAQLRLEHRLREARERLRTCVSQSCPAVVRDECAKRMDQVTLEIPTVVFEVRDGKDGKELSAVKVTMDDQLLLDHLDGSAIDLDPGEHRLTFEAPGRPPLTETIVVHEGDKNRAEVATLTAAPQPPDEARPAGAAPAGAAGGASPEVPTASVHRDGNAMRILGLTTAGVGAAGLVAGGVFGVLAFGSWDKANQQCPSHSGCSAQALGDRSNAVLFSTVSDVAFIAGAALAALGLSLTLLAPKNTASSAVTVQAGPAWVGLAGPF